jgi:hypothetical protein
VIKYSLFIFFFFHIFTKFENQKIKRNKKSSWHKVPFPVFSPPYSYGFFFGELYFLPTHLLAPNAPLQPTHLYI